MTEPSFSINYSASMLATEACSRMDLLVYDATLGNWRIATSANRTTAAAGAQAIALTAYGGSVVGRVAYKDTGIIPAELSGLSSGFGSKTFVRTSSTGRCERVTSPSPGDDIIGIAEKDGRVHLLFGLDLSIISSGIATPFTAGSAPFPSTGIGLNVIGQGFNWGLPKDGSPATLIAANFDTGIDRPIIQAIGYSGGPEVIKYGFNTAGAGDVRTYLFGDSIFFQGANASINIPSNTFAGATRAGVWGSRLCIGGNLITGPDSTYASFGNSLGPIMMLGGILTEPTTTPNDGTNTANTNAVRIWFNGSSNVVKFQFPGGQIAQLPATNGTLGFASAPGSTTQVIFNDGGAFGANVGFTYNKISGYATLSGGLAIGSTVAATGDIQVSTSAQGIIRGRNTGNTGDVSYLDIDASNNLYLGCDAAFTAGKQAGTINVYASSGGALALGIGNSTYGYVTSGAFQFWQPVSGSSLATVPFRFAQASVSCGAGTTTLTAAQYSCPSLILAGTPGAGFTVQAPLSAGAIFFVKNSIAFACTFKGATGTAATIGANAATTTVTTDGTNYY